MHCSSVIANFTKLPVLHMLHRKLEDGLYLQRPIEQNGLGVFTCIVIYTMIGISNSGFVELAIFEFASVIDCGQTQPQERSGGCVEDVGVNSTVRKAAQTTYQSCQVYE